MSILYIQKHFPALSETFVLNEICELLNLGYDVSILSMYNLNEKKIHDKVERYGLLKKTRSLKYHCPYRITVGNNFSKSEVFRKFFWEFIKNKDLSFFKRMNLLFLCYEKDNNLEIPFRRFLDYLDIISWIRKDRINHIHCHFAVKNLRLAYNLHRILGIPYSFTTYAHDIYFESERDLRKMALSAKKVITTSKYNQKYMASKFDIPLDRIDLVYSGIELDKFCPIEVKKEKLFTILNVGRLHPIKGQKYLIEACKILKDKKIKFQCWIIGEGEERKNLANQIFNLGLEDYVQLLGTKKNEELLKYYNLADVFVLPSISESMGVVNMEALACRTPVIASNVRGVPELVIDGYNGALVSPKNSKQIADKTIEFKNNKNLLTRLKENARKVVEDKFDIKKNVLTLINNLEIGNDLKTNSVLIDCCSLCQLNCVRCPASNGENKKSIIGEGYLKFNDFKKFIDNNLQIKRVELSGYGEMFLNPDLFKILMYAYNRGIKITASNGVNFNSASEKIIEALVKFKVETVTVSIDGASNKVYGIYRKNGNLDKVLDNIRMVNFYKRKYNSNYPNLIWQFVIFGHNEHEIPLAKKMASDLGMTFKTKLNWDPKYSPIKDRAFVRRETGLKVTDREEYTKKFNRPYMFPCKHIWFRPHITWKGDLIGCCFNRNISFGNVFDHGLDRCMNRKEYLSVKRVLLGEEIPKEGNPCFNCPIYRDNISKNPIRLKNLSAY